MTIKIATNYTQLLSREDPESFSKMFAAVELINGVRLTTVFSLGKGRHEDEPIFQNMIHAIKKILRRDDAAENLRILKMRARLEEDGPIETLNLLEEWMGSEKLVARSRERTRAVDSESMYEAMRDSYNSFKDELQEHLKK